MLENYLSTQSKEVKRLVAVQAALEIIKASVSAPTGHDGKEKLDRDCTHTVTHVATIADAIQEALKTE